MSDADRLAFRPEPPDTPPPGPLSSGSWHVLVVDDDDEVYAATRFALEGARILGRPVLFHYCDSARSARELLPALEDLAVVLLDVVMETSDAGLKLVNHIRADLGYADTRIILRTGQPGYAPELEVIRDYDINGYHSKDELSHTRLVTSLTAAIRAYDQLRAAEQSRRGLEIIVTASADLVSRTGTAHFARGVLTQLAALLRVPPEGIVCVQRGSPFGHGAEDGLFVVAAAGGLSTLIGHPLRDLAEPALRATVEACVRERTNLFGEHHTALFIRGGTTDGAALVRLTGPLSAVDRRLVEVFAANVASCFSTVVSYERMHAIAFRDTLTGLSNREGFLEALRSDSPVGRRPRVSVAVLQLRRFQDVADALGYETGTAAMVSVARRLRDAFDTRAIALARLGPGIFALAMPEGQLHARELVDLFREPLQAGDQKLALDVHAGVAHCGDGHMPAVVLLKNATIALNRAAADPHLVTVDFEPAMESDIQERLRVLRGLRQALRERRLEVWYQPQVNLVSGAVVGAEALARWPGPEGCSPGVFIPLAEEAGLIGEVGAFVLDTTCADLAKLRAAGVAMPRLSVNASVPQLRDEGFAGSVLQALRAHGLQPRDLEVEVTESVAVDEIDAVVETLQALRAAGIAVAMDDFGTGYSNLLSVGRLPLEALKVDQRFVREIGEGNAAYAELVLRLAQGAGLEAIAEGVETLEQAEFMRSRGCRIAQGFLYARPMPRAELERWLAAWPEAAKGFGFGA